MNSRVTTIGSIAKVLGVAAIGAVTAGMVCLRSAQQMLQIQVVRPPDSLSLAIAASILVLGVYHLASLVALATQQRNSESLRGIRAVSIALGVVSTILVAADTVLLQDIGQQFESGLESTQEWIIVTTTFSIHAAYVLLSMAIISQTQRALRRPGTASPADASPAGTSDMLFVTRHYIGLFTGWTGLAFLGISILASLWNTEITRQTVPLFSLIIGSPFILATVTWGIARLRRRTLWDDEKQATDVRGGFLVATVPTAIVGALLYACQIALGEAEAIAVYWFPLLAFTHIAVLSTRIAMTWRAGVPE